MNTATLIKLTNTIIKKANEPTAEDECEDEFFNPGNWSGGNFDDCYQLGVEAGQVLFANYLLMIMTNEGE